MMPTDSAGNKMTANVYAKVLVLAHGERAFYWREQDVDAWSVTDREGRLIDAAVEKQYTRVEKFLGVSL